MPSSILLITKNRPLWVGFRNGDDFAVHHQMAIVGKFGDELGHFLWLGLGLEFWEGGRKHLRLHRPEGKVIE